VNAPERPRADDVRRYCLACSERTGRLVRRVCPVLDRQREATAAKRAARSTRQRDRGREAEVAARSAGGLDLLAEARRLWRTPTLRAESAAQGRSFPTIEWRRSRNGKAHTSGHCYYTGKQARVVVTIGTDAGGAIETVIHELVHAALPYNVHHSARFWTTLMAVAREAYPNVDFGFHASPTRGWALDDWIGRRIGQSRR
jgi:hypothetical protein